MLPHRPVRMRLLSNLLHLFKKTEPQMDKFLIVGLGNPGAEYEGTRHNTGYMVLDALAKASNIIFEDKRYGYVAETSLKGRKLILLKPTTFMNLSGFRLKANGSNGGHNGLGHIQQLIGQQYARLRMGIGNEFNHGGQIDWVLGKYSDEEKQILQPAIDTAVEVIKSFVLAGIDITMNQFNNKGKKAKV